MTDEGTRVRREVLGDDHVDAAQAATTWVDDAFQALITDYAWGRVWARGTLARPTRSLITIALLAALGCEDELAMHLRAARRTGAAPEEIAEALLMVGVYAGVPRANVAFRLAKEEFGADRRPSDEETT